MINTALKLRSASPLNYEAGSLIPCCSAFVRSQHLHTQLTCVHKLLLITLTTLYQLIKTALNSVGVNNEGGFKLTAHKQKLVTLFKLLSTQ